MAATVATRKAAHEAVQGAVCHVTREEAQEAVHTAALETGRRWRSGASGVGLGKEAQQGRAEGEP